MEQKQCIAFNEQLERQDRLDLEFQEQDICLECPKSDVSKHVQQPEAELRRKNVCAVMEREQDK